MSDTTQPGRHSRRGRIPRALRLTAAGVASLTLALHATTNAQPLDRPVIVIAASIAAEAASQVPFPIRINPASSIPRNSFVRVRGLPEMAALSEGHSIAPGSWAVPLGALPGLRIMVPASVVGRANVYVTLVAVDGSVLVEAKSVLVINAPPPPSALVPDAPAKAAPVTILGPGGRLPPPPQIAPPVIAPEDRERALRFLKKGDEQMAEGLVAPARLLYERAAELGLAQAAMALAATYDAAELTRPNSLGIQPDAKEAKRWYESARALGARDAEQRLQRLGAK